MTETSSLDQKIRSRAREELEKQLRAAFEPAKRFATMCMYTEGRRLVNYGSIHTEGGQLMRDRLKYTDVKGMFDSLHETIYNALVKEFENRAVDDFIRSVEGLQGQIDELRSGIDD